MSKKKWITEEIIPQVNLETVYYTPRATSKTFYYTPSKNKVTNNVSDILPSIGNNSDSIEDAQKQYKNSKIIYNILENKFRENAKNNNVILPYKTGEHTSISNYEPSNFTILENSKIDENKNYKMLPTYSNLTSSKNNKNITKVNSMSSNPLDLDITSKLKSGVENKKRYDEYVSQDNVKQDLIKLRDARNDIALNKYNLDLARVNNHDINTYDKTLGRFVDGGKSMLPNINTTYTREDGVEVALPTYNDLKEQKTVQSYETGVGKFLGDAASNIGRIAVSSAINSVIPYAGTVAYFGDMFADQYNNNLINGYDETSSLLNASIGTATEAVTEKILGGIGGKLFGGSSEMSEGLAKGISKLIKNKRIVSIFSNGASEAIEEFVQTFTEKLNEQLTLEKKFNPKEIFSLDTLSEAIYSAGIGALTGGVLSGIGKVDPNISKIVDDNNTKNNTSKIDSMENTVPSNTKYTTESIRFNENDVNALESLTLNTKFFEDNNIPVKVTLNDVYTTLLNSNTNKDLTDKLSYYNKKYAKTDFFDFVENVANGTIDYKTIENNVLSKKDSMKDISSEKEKLIGEIGTKSVDENGKEIYKISSKGLNLVESYLAYNGADNKIDEIKNIQDFMNGRNIEARFDATVFNNESLNAVWETKEGKTNVVFNPNASKEAIIEEIAIHEMLHDIINQETTISNNLFNDVLNYSKTIENYKSIRDDISESYSKYYDKDSKDFSHKIDEEVVAKTLEKQLGTQEYITRIVNNNASLAQKIYRWIIDKLQTFNESIGFKSEKIYWESVKNKFEKAYRSQDYSNAEKNDIRNKIVTKNNKTWVKADRQVISGTNPDLWTKQVENYINNNIRNNKDVIVYGIDGDELTITSDTAGKATFRNDVKMSDGSTRKMTDQEFLAKLKAEIHIDELAETSKRGKKNVPDYKNHSFAKDGFNYRTTYFEDNDGNYYKITMSVGINGNIKTIYNVGKMENYNSKKETGKFSGSKAKPVSFDDNIPQTYTKVNSNTLSNKYSIQEAKKNTQELKKSSFSLEQRVSGDDLLDAQDLIEEIKSVGANVDKNGYVTLYHQTTNENADKIKQTGKMIANEPYVYFSTSKDASQSDGRGNTKLEFKIPAEKLILDDIFSDNADVKIKLNGNKELDVSNYINNKNQDLEKYIFDDDFYEQFKYESKDKITKSIEELQKELETVDDSTDEGWSKGYNIRQNIRALQNGYDNQYDYIVGKEKDRLTEQYKNGFLDKKIQEKIKLENKAKQLEEDIKTSSKFKNAQFEIIQKTNPAPEDSNYVWIRKPSDIKTFEEIVNDKDSFNWGDYSREDALRDLKKGTVTIYSSYPIKNGVFVSTSYQQALDYAGGDPSRVHSRKSSINSIAWINGDEGQYAKTNINRDKSFNGKTNILELKEKSKDVLFAGDDVNEFGYFPSETRNSLTTNKELKTNLNVKGTKTKFGELFNKNIVLPTFKENNSSNKKLGNNVLPTATDIKKINENKIPSFKNSEYTPDDVNKNVDLKSNELKKKNLNKINNNKVSIDKLVDARNETLKNIDNQIKKKRELYNSKKNKNTKIANIIQQQIISMESSKKSITEAYKQRIERLEDRNRKLSNKDNITNLQRKNVSEQYRELAESIVIDNIDSWKDKKIGLAYKTEKMERNIYDIIPDKNVAKTVVDTYITPLKIAEVNQKNFINEYVDRIKKLGLTEEESVAVQLFGEAKFNISTMEADTERAQKILKRENAKTDEKENAQFYLDAVEYINTNKLDIDKIQNAVKEFRKIYNELFIKVNSVLKEQGYKEMDYKKDYFPHFTERKATSKFGMLMEKLGWKKINNDIPTDIAGITDTFKPGKIYFNHLQRRYGNITEYNALKGFDNYIGGASNLIYLTEPIQKLRAFENEIRYLHSEKGIQEKYNEIIQSDVDTDTKESQITQLFANASNPLNNFVTELRSYTDGIANKKSELDRRIEQAFNRGIYSTMSNIQSRVSANMVGLNISSALTNFIPITQAYSQVSTKNMLQAIKLSIKNSVSSDSFVENSEFLSNRLIKSEKLCQTKLEKFSDKANIMFDAIDSFTSNVVVRSKYLENIEKGMSPTAALKNADTFANNVMAGRDKASLPTIFNSKNPFIKLFSSFQLEVNNQYKYMLKDLPNDLKDEAVSKLIAAFAKMFFGAWFYNLFSEKITGRKSAFSPADIVLDGINTMSNENASFFENSMTVAKDVASELPFLGNILGGGRLPISSALPDVSNSVESVSTLLNKETKKSTKKTALNNLVKELSKPVFYIVPPFGGGQAKKTIEGLSMYTKDIPGSYTSSGRLRFTADEGFLPVVQAGIFGQYASKNAREYFDNSYSPLTEKQIEEFSSLGIEINEYRTYLKKYSELNKIKADVGPEGNTINGSAKAKKIYELLNNNEKYSENEVNYILSKLSTENETITLDDLMLIENDLESYKYYFSLSSDGRDKYKALILNNGIDQKKYISSIQKIKNIKEKYANVKNPYTGTKKEKYKTYISNSKKNEIFNVINESNISKAEKIILFKEAGYSITNYKKYMFSYINSLNISKSKKEEIWKYLYEN